MEKPLSSVMAKEKESSNALIWIRFVLRSAVVILTVLVWVSTDIAHGITAQSAPLEKLVNAIKLRRERAAGISVNGETTLIKTSDADMEEHEPVSSTTTFNWRIASKVSRFRLEEARQQPDLLNGEPFEMETILAFDGKKSVLWRPHQTFMSDGTPILDASKMSAENSFWRNRVVGPVFWWVGVLDDPEAIIAGTPTILANAGWKVSIEDDMVVATTRSEDREREFVFDSNFDFNVVSSIRRLNRGGDIRVTSDTTVQYERVNGEWLPKHAVRQISDAMYVESTVFSSWQLGVDLPVEDARLPVDFLQPGMLVSDDKRQEIQQVSQQKTLVPRPKQSLTQPSSNQTSYFLLLIVVGGVVGIGFVLHRRSH